jgi:hypothetical protein
MGLRHVKFAAVEQTYESIHLNQYLDLYDTIAASVGRKKRFTLTEEHLHMLAILEENIETLLWKIEDKVDILSIKPYQMRFAAAKSALAEHIKELNSVYAFYCQKHLLHTPRVKALLGHT